ncbi:hypothetical protein J437_LFUL011313 [Ladona fulva]|uniref:Uncharacterized protein n=1 Tax=Ladona fulva TaxID=123851 RepID=A0A8K0P530_LADFU|nr:hypothetical protein J437_LFUL011313 [Ladona fulva]
MRGPQGCRRGLPHAEISEISSKPSLAARPLAIHIRNLRRRYRPPRRPGSPLPSAPMLGLVVCMPFQKIPL